MGKIWVFLQPKDLLDSNSLNINAH